MIPPEERDLQAAFALQHAWRLTLAANLLITDEQDPRFPGLLNDFRGAIGGRELSQTAALDEAERRVAAANSYKSINTRKRKSMRLREDIERAWQDPSIAREKSEVAATMIANRFGVSQRTAYNYKPKIPLGSLQ